VDSRRGRLRYTGYQKYDLVEADVDALRSEKSDRINSPENLNLDVRRIAETGPVQQQVNSVAWGAYVNRIGSAIAARATKGQFRRCCSGRPAPPALPVTPLYVEAGGDGRDYKSTFIYDPTCAGDRDICRACCKPCGKIEIHLPWRNSGSFVTKIAPFGTVALLSPNLFHERGTTDQIARLVRNTLCLYKTELPLILRRGEIGGEFFQFGDGIGS
jgi:hypothetical protein